MASGETKKSFMQGPKEELKELKKLRFAEMDAAYAKQLKALSDMMHSARHNLNRMRRR